MPGMEELKNLLGELLEALAWLAAFCFVAVMPVSLPLKWTLILGWFVAGCYALYRKARHERERVPKD